MTIKRVDNNAYEIKHLKVDVELGDRKNPGIFKPKLKLKRWDGECSLDIDFAEDTTDEEIDEELDGKGNITKIKWKAKTPNYELELEYYLLEPREFEENGHTVKQLEEGGLEFNIILKNKPTTNNIVLPIKIKGLKFYYQPELTQKEKDKGTFRPENVVGSYAVYHATRTNMHRSKEYAEKYKCGKAFHIYRPKVVDDVGSEIWADININNDVITITIPQHFLDDAVYPVRVDPDFGFTGIGDSEYGPLPQDMLAGSAYTSPAVADMTGVSMSAYCYAFDGAENIKMGIWANSDGGALIANGLTGVGAAGAGYGWVSANFATAPDIAASTTYLLSFVDEEGGITIKFDTGAGVNHIDYANSYAAPGNFDWDETDTMKMSIFCTYEIPAPPPPVPANPLIGKPLISHDIIKKATIR